MTGRLKAGESVPGGKREGGGHILSATTEGKVEEQAKDRHRWTERYTQNPVDKYRTETQGGRD